MKNGNGARLAALLLALALCLTACLPAALAQEYAGPSEDEGWEAYDDWWGLKSEPGNIKKVTYTLPFKSDKGILINANASMTAPSIEVTGNVETSGSGKIVCAGLLFATGKVSSNGTITAGSLSCNEISVVVDSRIIVKTSLTCTGTVTVNGTLILPANFDINTLKLDQSATGTIYVGTKAYNADGTPRDGATIYLTDGYDVSDEGFTWDSATCTLTLTSFTREYRSNIVGQYGAGIVIDVPGKAVTLVLNGTNTLTGLGADEEQTGIACSAKSLTLKGGGSLNCEASLAALILYDGGIQLEDCVLRDGKKIYTAYDGDGSPLGSYVAEPYDDDDVDYPARAKSFSLRQNSYAVTLHPNGGKVNSGNVTAYDYGVGATLPTATDVTREGYTFAGWYDNEALTGSPVTAIGPTDEGDKTYWAKWNLIPGDKPVFTEPSGPREVTVRPGDKATLTASATNATTCQWYVNRNDGAGYVKLSGATDMTYTTSAVTLDNDGYTYYCEATNTYGEARSPRFTLRVSEAAAAIPPQTGDDSHTGLWLALALVSLGGLCAAVYTARRRRGGAR